MDPLDFITAEIPKALADAMTLLRIWLRADLAIAFLAGALAVASGARLSFLGAALTAFAGLAPNLGLEFDAMEIAVLNGLAIVMILAGLVQGVVTALAGEDAAAHLFGLVLIGAVLFLIWRGPLRIVRAILQTWGAR